MPKINVSFGELLDKFTILEIKLQKIDHVENHEKIVNIRHEYEQLIPKINHLYEKYGDIHAYYKKLLEINERLWEIEELLRNHEKNQTFDQMFIDLAREVYKKNDERSRLKKEVNEITQSDIKEEKSY